MEYKNKNNGFIKEYLDDPFFQSLKNDYEEFSEWYIKSIDDPNKESHYWINDDAVTAFIGLKSEDDTLTIGDVVFPKNKRLKITTIKSNNELDSFSEFVIYLSIQKAKRCGIQEVYFSVIPDTPEKTKLMEIALSYGFQVIGKSNRSNKGFVRKNDELFLLKVIKNTNSIDWKLNYPYMPLKENRIWKYLILDPHFHDTFIQDAILKNKIQMQDFTKMAIKKVYIHNQRSLNELSNGDGFLIYRKDESNMPGKKYRSCVTGYGVHIETKAIKDFHTYDDFKKYVKNYHAFSSEADLQTYFKNNGYVTLLTLNHTFGEGNNITTHELIEMGMWPESNSGFTPFELSFRDEKIMQMKSYKRSNNE